MHTHVRMLTRVFHVSRGRDVWLTGCHAPIRFLATLQYGDGGLFGSYCIWGAGALLGHPNDGLVTISKTGIPYGNAMPVYKGECHSVGMHYPPQCKNSDRNKEVNKEAAR